MKKIKCPKCSEIIKLPDDEVLTSQKINCPKCNAVLKLKGKAKKEEDLPKEEKTETEKLKKETTSPKFLDKSFVKELEIPQDGFFTPDEGIQTDEFLKGFSEKEEKTNIEEPNIPEAPNFDDSFISGEPTQPPKIPEIEEDFSIPGIPSEETPSELPEIPGEEPQIPQEEEISSAPISEKQKIEQKTELTPIPIIEPPKITIARYEKRNYKKIIFGVLASIAIAVGFIWLITNPNLLQPIVSSFFQKEEINKNLTLSKVEGKFLRNVRGQILFLIRGVAKNTTDKTINFIKLKATLKDSSGSNLLVRDFYAGNILSEDEIRTITSIQANERFNNKLGNELSNMNIPPGGTVEFMVIFYDIDREELGFEVKPISYD